MLKYVMPEDKRDEAYEGIRELILKWKGQEADFLTVKGHRTGGLDYIIDNGRLHALQACIRDLQTLYAELVD